MKQKKEERIQDKLKEPRKQQERDTFVNPTPVPVYHFNRDLGYMGKDSAWKERHRIQ